MAVRPILGEKTLVLFPIMKQVLFSHGEKICSQKGIFLFRIFIKGFIKKIFRSKDI